VKTLNELVADIALSSEQQTQGLNVVGKAVESLNESTQQTASASEESASAANELHDHAGRLKEMVARFRLSDARTGADRSVSQLPKASRGIPALTTRPGRAALPPGEKP
jgi:methyl-accepting chemotaxis protein